MSRKVDPLTVALLGGMFVAYAVGVASGDAWLCRIAALYGIALSIYAGMFVLTGLAGMVSLGVSAVVGVGAYATAAGLVRADLGTPASLLLGAVAGAVVSWLIAASTRSLADHYLTLATLAASEVLANVFRGWDSMTGGASGFTGIPKPSLFGYALQSPAGYAPLCLALGGGVVLLVGYVRKTAFGFSLLAYREEGRRVEAIGLDSARLRRGAFLLAGACAGLAGGLGASIDGFVGPESFGVPQSIAVLCFFVLGSERGIGGIFISAALSTVLTEALRQLGEWQNIGVGTIALALLAIRARKVSFPCLAVGAG